MGKWNLAGWTVIGSAACPVALGVAWWLTERAVRVPLIQVSYLTRRDVGVPYAITFLIAFGIYGPLSATTRLAQTPVVSGYGWGWSTLAVGWFALPQIIAALLAIVALREANHAGKPTLAAFTTGFLICGACALVALGLCIPLLRPRAVAAPVPESAGAGVGEHRA